MSGLYLHIPFCRQACHYCNFHFSTSLARREAMVAALVREIELRAPHWPTRDLQTIYWGGGTPSLLTAAELADIFAAIERHFHLAPNAEITLEANPDDLTDAKLDELRALPINRLSIGIQSFASIDLTFMNRAHTAEEAAHCLDRALARGFDDLTVDLIYGSPTTSDEQWADNVRRVLSYGIPHVSAYALTVEPKTALDHFVRSGKAPATDDEQAARQFDYLMDAMAAAGYEHYEISNFARPGRYSRHNTSYWQGKPYLGIGPSAHSYDGARLRTWNVANNTRYLNVVADLSGPEQYAAAAGLLYESEQLQPTDRYNEYVLTRLRTQWGCKLPEIAAIAPAFAEHFRREVMPFLRQGTVVAHPDDTFTLSRAGKLLADGIAAELFFTPRGE